MILCCSSPRVNSRRRDLNLNTLTEHILNWDMTQSYEWYAWHDSIVRVTRFLIVATHKHTQERRPVSSNIFTGLIFMCDMFHTYVWHVSHVRVTWQSPEESLRVVVTWQNSFWCVAWLSSTCDLTLCFSLPPANYKGKPVSLIMACLCSTGFGLWHDSIVRVKLNVYVYLYLYIYICIYSCVYIYI